MILAAILPAESSWTQTSGLFSVCCCAEWLRRFTWPNTLNQCSTPEHRHSPEALQHKCTTVCACVGVNEHWSHCPRESLHMWECARACIHGSWQWGRLLVLSVNEDNEFITNQMRSNKAQHTRWMCHWGDSALRFYCRRKTWLPLHLPFPVLLCSNFLPPDHLLFGHWAWRVRYTRRHERRGGG